MEAFWRDNPLLGLICLEYVPSQRPPKVARREGFSRPSRLFFVLNPEVGFHKGIHLMIP